MTCDAMFLPSWGWGVENILTVALFALCPPISPFSKPPTAGGEADPKTSDEVRDAYQYFVSYKLQHYEKVAECFQPNPGAH